MNSYDNNDTVPFLEAASSQRPKFCHLKRDYFFGGRAMNTVTYVVSLLTFYLKGEIRSEQNFVVFQEPNTILGLIPLGKHTDRIPVHQIASVSTNFRLKLGKLVCGILAFLFGFGLFGQPGGFLPGLIILILAVNWILDAFEIDLTLITTSGAVKRIDFFIFDKEKAVLAEQQIHAMISNRMSDTNVREQTDRVVDAINRKCL